MKKLVFAVLAAALVFASCDNGGMEEVNPFVGTWENENNGYKIGFTKTIATGYYPNGDIYWTGTYTYNETHITTALDQNVSAQDMLESHGNTFIAKYRFEDDKLIFNGNSCIKINN